MSADIDGIGHLSLLHSAGQSPWPGLKLPRLQLPGARSAAASKNPLFPSWSPRLRCLFRTLSPNETVMNFRASAPWQVCFFLLTLLLCGLTSATQGQDTTDNPMTAVNPMAADLTLDQLEAKISQIQEDPNFAEEEKKQIVSQLSQARQALQDLPIARDQTTLFEEMRNGVAQETQRLDTKLSEMADPLINVPTNATPAELKQLKAEADTTRVRLEQQVEVLKNEPTRRQTRASTLPNEISERKMALEAIKAQLAETPPPGEPPQLTSARKTRLAAQQLLFTQQLAALEAEQAAYPATNPLIPNQTLLAAKELLNHEKYLTALEEQLRIQTAKETQEKVDEAEAREEQTLPELRPLAEEVRKITEDYQEQMRKVGALDAALTSLNETIKDETDEFDRRKQRVETLGVTNALGRLLREKRASLKRERLSLTQKRRNNTSVRDAQEQVFSISEQLGDLLETESADMEALINKVVQSYPDLPPEQIEAEVKSFFEERLKSLGMLQTAYQTTFEKLVSLDSTRLEYLRLIDIRLSYIDERVLWIRSDPFLSGEEIEGFKQDAKQLVTPGRWEKLLTELMAQPAYNSIFLALLILLCVTLGLYRTKTKKLLAAEGKIAAKRRCREFTPTLKSILYTLVLSLFWPGIFALLGWRIRMGEDPELFSYVLGNATLATVLFIGPFEWVRHLVRDQGLAESHFAVSKPIRNVLRLHTKWLVTSGALLLWIVAVNIALEEGSLTTQTWSGALGRFALLLLLLQLTVQVGMLFNPRKGIGVLMKESDTPHILYRFRLLFFLGLGFIFPLLAILLCFGFGYTAIILTKQLLYSAGVIIGVISVSLIIRRWLLIRRRRLAMKQYLERVEKQREREESGLNTAEALPFEMPEEEAVNLAALNQQSIRLLYGCMTLVGGFTLWMIWNDVLPAFKQVGRMELWKVDVSGELVTVTFSSLFLATFVLAMTFFASKNLPALLEMFLLAQLPFDSGARFAIKTITRYVLIVMGVIIGLSILRVQWSQYQWLVAGATVGLGFGLQEIFANFVSGIIVLLERPCRVGDVVTVGEVTGVVSRIQIRATTVTNWDRQELIVPNREFVTGRLLNWTLSNAINRLTVPVGIAYGSDTELATRLLTEVVQANENVLEDPPPVITFENFGASSLDFTIRCYLPSLDNRLATVHELHTQIDRVFRENNIEISFPQHDLHLRTVSSDVSQALASGFGIRLSAGKNDSSSN
jgi:potassium efflux system protein